MINSVDPDQLASLQKPTDLDLHCFQRQGTSWFSRTQVNTCKLLLLMICIILSGCSQITGLHEVLASRNNTKDLITLL